MNIYLLISLIVSGLILLSPFAKFIRKNKGPKQLANIVITFGILGTFGGIVWALIQFDVSDIDNSVPKLLDGMKFSFLTSVFGILTSIILRIFPSAYLFKESIEQKEDGVLGALMIIADRIERVEKSMVGDIDSSIVTQLVKMRTSFGDQLSDLNKSFGTFAEKVVANSTDSLIEAVEVVIRNFNEKINEQFGENFIIFNEAVAKLESWQSDNKDQLLKLNTSFKETLSEVNKITQLSGELAENAGQFQGAVEAVGKTVTLLETNMESYIELNSKIKDLVPDVSGKLDEVLQNLDRSVQASTTTLEKNAQNINAQIENLNTYHSQIQGRYQSLVKGMNDSLKRTMDDSTKRMAEQVSNLDKQLGDELNKALSTLGNQLASLSDKFVEDYTPLTRKLAKVVEIAKKIEE